MPAPTAAGRSLAALTIFLGALLLFAVQPLIAKMILPWFGGSAAVWIACLLFFQFALLAGYAYAHLLVRHVAPARQWQAHAGLLCLSLLFLPIVPEEGWKPDELSAPLPRILALLGATIGLPFVMLAATSPLVQAWRARASGGSRSVYRFYALSNLGSLLALLSYPIAIEPFLPTRLQAWLWSFSYVLFAVVCAAVGWRYREAAREDAAPAEPDGAAPGALDRALWLLLAAVPSAMLLAVTNHMLRTVAAIPLLWILPLSLYLVSFIICFDSPRWYYRPLWHGIFPAAVGTMLLSIVAPFLFSSYAAQLAVYSAAFFICCMVCHGELALLKPAPRRLTSYFLTVASGGAVGGLSVAVLAPLVLDYDHDLTIALLLLTALMSFVLWRASKSTPRWIRVNSVLLVLCAWPALFLILSLPSQANSGLLFAGRNFYGPLQVRRIPASAVREEIIELQHGATVHGRQFTADEASCHPLSYYAPPSGIGAAVAAMTTEAPLHLGVVGLGAGSIAGYARAEDRLRFYEIDPLVRAVAGETFRYLACAQEPRIVMGDARLSLEREEPGNFDILVVDAFSGDAIPVHLLTREAFAVYWRHLKPGGVLAFHVTNTFVDLVPIVAAAAAESGKAARVMSNDADFARGISQAVWVLVAGRPEIFNHPAFNAATPIAAADSVWSDDYSNLWHVLRW